MSCSVCGMTNGAHLRECIDRLIAVNNQAMAKCVNRLYYQLHEVYSRRIIDYMAMGEALEKTRDDLNDLKVLNCDDKADSATIISAT